MKYFKLDELIRSNTANRLKINNRPSKEIEAKLVRLIDEVLDPIREKWKKPITVTSGYRCKDLNKAVGGVSTSQHCKGEAADITTTDNKALFATIVQMIEDGEIKVGQLIDEKGYRWLHISLPTNNKVNQILHLK